MCTPIQETLPQTSVVSSVTVGVLMKKTSSMLDSLHSRRTEDAPEHGGPELFLNVRLSYAQENRKLSHLREPCDSLREGCGSDRR